MENELVKKLCAKQGFEEAAFKLINEADINAFKALVDKSEFLFDFVKQNVIKRLQNCINENNYKNLLTFLKIYSYDYEDLIVSNIKKYADENFKNIIYDKLLNGTNEEKTYCIKILDTNKIIDILAQYKDSNFEPLAYNCAKLLGSIHDKESFNEALANLDSSDDFKVLEAVKFLTAYNDKKAVPYLLDTMKKSSLAENIACEIIYLQDIFEILKTNYSDAILLINYIISGLGEIIPLATIFDIQLYELIEHISSPVTLLHIKQKINQLTENDEYLFDEDKTVKEEINEIKNLLNSKPEAYWDNLCDELSFDDNLIFFTLGIISELKLDYSVEIKELINNTNNQTLILKATETLKTINKLSEISKDDIIKKINDTTIKAIIESYFE